MYPFFLPIFNFLELDKQSLLSFLTFFFCLDTYTRDGVQEALFMSEKLWTGESL